MKRLAFLLVTVLVLLPVGAQNNPSLRLDIPERASQEFYLLMKRGVVTDTLVKSRFNEKGYYLFQPEKRKLPSGIMVLSMPPYTWFEFVWSGTETFTLSCKEEYPHTENVVFTGSTENDHLDRWFNAQHFREEKQRLCDAGLQLYKSPEFQHFIFSKEKQRLEEESVLLADTLKNSKLYAARYLELRRFLSGKAAPLVVNPDSVLWSDTRQYLRDSLDLSSLYTSGQWFDVINACLELYANGSRYHNEFGGDMIHILKRIDSQEVFEVFASNLLTMCEQFNWPEAENQIVSYLSTSDRAVQLRGNLQKVISMAQVKAGNPAPSIAGFNVISEKMKHLPVPKGYLVVFYESGCHNCDVQLGEIKKQYEKIQTQGLRVVSISADNDQHVFDFHSKDYPWPDKLCDYNGFEGENFKNYGVIGTPTIFMIDEKGIIQGRYARLEDAVPELVKN